MASSLIAILNGTGMAPDCSRLAGFPRPATQVGSSGARAFAYLFFWRLGSLHLRPLVRPLGDGLDRARQGTALLRQRVLDTDGGLGHHGPLHDGVLLELLQTLAEHAVGDLRDGVAEGGEAA